ncbi:MAG TPA: gamma-glutamyltransferase family protein [Thermomicrobiaceae bacterium]|nr:gamma-glutamyltransferase family protein [Thermomicrobiaceae bacterium]
MAGFPAPTTMRPAITGSHYVAAAGHELATMAAVRMLEAGGNAIDAGVAAGLCTNVLQPDMTNVGGVAPIILFTAADRQLHTISGLGSWPAAATPEYFVAQCGGRIPAGVRHCVMPAAIDSWTTALRLYGTMSFAEVAAPAVALAEEGFAAYPFLCANLAADAERLAQWPSSAAIYLPNGRAPRPGERLVQKDLAGLLRRLVEAEEGARHLEREAAIQAARDRFYQGDIAERTARFFAEQGGFLTLEDLKNFHVEVEEPVGVRYRGYQIYSCPPWCQGPVAAQALAILEGYDLATLGQNSADCLHLIIEALDAAFADREQYYGDPKFVDVPIDGLLDPGYAAAWRERIARERAFGEMPAAGDPWPFQPGGNGRRGSTRSARAFEARVDPDTSYLCVVDEAGNAFSATPSDGVTNTPIVPGLGYIVSGRGGQSWLDPNHPSVLAPGKRPRLTPSPGLILKDGALFAPYGTPGNDVQPQAMVQLAVNLIDFGMEPQAAVEAPRVASFNYPRSSFPHPYSPGLVNAEARIPDEVLAELARRGHRIERWPDWEPRAGSLCTVVVDHARGLKTGAADPRRLAYAIGW